MGIVDQGSRDLRRHDFQRALLDSANADGPSSESTKRAWDKFSTAIAGTAGAAAMSGAAAGLSGAAGKAAALGAKRAFSWLLMGALAGGALTAAWFVSRPAIVVHVATPVAPPEAPHRAPPALAEEAPPSNAHVPPSSSPSSASPVSTPRAELGPSKRIIPKSEPAPSIVEPSADPAASPAIADAELNPAPSKSTASNLAAEIAALDKGLSALSKGHPDEALQCIHRYRVEYPEGALARDADVVAIEALAAKKERAELSSATSQFLAAYPKDPHASRVRWLAEH